MRVDDDYVLENDRAMLEGLEPVESNAVNVAAMQLYGALQASGVIVDPRPWSQIDEADQARLRQVAFQFRAIVRSSRR